MNVNLHRPVPIFKPALDLSQSDLENLPIFQIPVTDFSIAEWCLDYTKDKLCPSFKRRVAITAHNKWDSGIHYFVSVNLDDLPFLAKIEYEGKEITVWCVPKPSVEEAETSGCYSSFRKLDNLRSRDIHTDIFLSNEIEDYFTINSPFDYTYEEKSDFGKFTCPLRMKVYLLWLKNQIDTFGKNLKINEEEFEQALDLTEELSRFSY